MAHEQEGQRSLPENPSLVVVGELNVDLIFEQVNSLPALEKERCAENMSIVLGSSSAILASNAQAIGLPAGFVGCTGSDTFGDFVVQVLLRRGVDTSRIKVLPNVATGATVVYTYGTRRGMITYPGAMDHLTIDDIPWGYVEQGSHLHVSSLFLQRGLRPDCKQLFARAKEVGLTTSLDTGWDPDEEWGADVLSVLEAVDVFFPNDEEAKHISGKTSLEEALQVLASRGCAVAITCGKDGVIATDGGDVVQLPAISVDPVDAIGAGDSFNAGFLSRYMKGCSFEECLHYGLMAGAYSTLAAGGTAAFEEGGFQEFVEEQRALYQ